MNMVCLDGRSLSLADGTGISTYAAGLQAMLASEGRLAGRLIDGTSRDTRAQRWLNAAWPGRTEAVCRPGPNGSTTWTAADAYRRAQVHFDIHRSLRRLHSNRPPAIMHWAYPMPLVFEGAANITTIHDMIPWLQPGLTGIDRSRFIRMLHRIAHRAAHIVTVSENSRRDIIAALGLDETRVTNTYQPVDVAAAPPEAPPGHHFLFYGTIEPRKNLARLIQAHHASATMLPLILAGPDGWHGAEELAQSGRPIKPLSRMPASPIPGRPGGVWRAPYLPRPALLGLLVNARALLFPSLAEGFGLPVAEAMALGIPALTSKGGATGEIAGEAALLVDPHDTRAIAAGIAALAASDELCAQLTAAGRMRVATFSAAACRARLATVYETLSEHRV